MDIGNLSRGRSTLLSHPNYIAPSVTNFEFPVTKKFKGDAGCAIPERNLHGIHGAVTLGNKTCGGVFSATTNSDTSHFLNTSSSGPSYLQNSSISFASRNDESSLVNNSTSVQDNSASQN